MKKSGISVNIPGLGRREIRRIVSDYTGTLSFHGRLSAGIRNRLLKLMQTVDLDVITSDSYGTAGKELKGIVSPYLLRRTRHDIEKAAYVRNYELKHVAAFGNGNNDRLMLGVVKKGGGIAIAVDNGEGCALDAVLNSHLLVRDARNALDLLLIPNACKATLRF
jgi:soluble P-type ATPase